MSTDATNALPPGNPPDKPKLAPLPRLRVHHILVWTAVTAAWLTLARMYFETFHSAVGVQRSMVHSSLLGAAILYGAATTVAGLGIYWRAKGLAFFTQPGHWLSCWNTFGIFWTIFVHWQMQSILGSSVQGWLRWFVFNSWIGLFAVGACLIWLAIWAADTKAWRILFVGWAICKCLAPLLGAVGWRRTLVWFGVPWYVTQNLVPLGLLVHAALNDFRNRNAIHRHWSHWAGVVVSASLMCFEMVMFVWIWLASPQR